MSERARVWRCQPEPVSAWQKSLGWILAGVTLVESTLVAKMLHFSHPILVGVLVGVVSGWRRLANGAPAHVWLVAGRPTLYLPARAGFAFLLALQTPREVIDQLRRVT